MKAGSRRNPPAALDPQVGFYDGKLLDESGQSLEQAYGRIVSDGTFEVKIRRSDGTFPVRCDGQLASGSVVGTAYMKSGKERVVFGSVDADRETPTARLWLTFRDNGSRMSVDLRKRPWTTYTHLSVQIAEGEGTTVPISISADGALYAELFDGVLLGRFSPTGDFNGTYTKAGLSKDVMYGFTSMDGLFINLTGSSAPAPDGVAVTLRLMQFKE